MSRLAFHNAHEDQEGDRVHQRAKGHAVNEPLGHRVPDVELGLVGIVAGGAGAGVIRLLLVLLRVPSARPALVAREAALQELLPVVVGRGGDEGEDDEAGKVGQIQREGSLLCWSVGDRKRAVAKSRPRSSPPGRQYSWSQEEKKEAKSERRPRGSKEWMEETGNKKLETKRLGILLTCAWYASRNCAMTLETAEMAAAWRVVASVDGMVSEPEGKGGEGGGRG